MVASRGSHSIPAHPGAASSALAISIPTRQCMRRYLREVAVVAVGTQRRQHGRVEQAAGAFPAFDRPGDELDRFARHHHVLPRHCIQQAQLAVGQETAPASFELIDARHGFVEERGPATDDDDLRVGAHRMEAPFSWHASS